MSNLVAYICSLCCSSQLLQDKLSIYIYLREIRLYTIAFHSIKPKIGSIYFHEQTQPCSSDMLTHPHIYIHTYTSEILGLHTKHTLFVSPGYTARSQRIMLTKFQLPGCLHLFSKCPCVYKLYVILWDMYYVCKYF